MVKKFQKIGLLVLMGTFLLMASCEYPFFDISPLHKVRSTRVSGLYNFEFSADRSKVVGAICTEPITYSTFFGVSSTCASSALSFMDLSTLSENERSSDFDGIVFSFAASPDGRTFVAAGCADVDIECEPFPLFPLLFICNPVYSGGRITIWDSQTCELETTKLVSAPVKAAAFSNDGRLFTAVLSTGHLLVWETQTWNLMEDIILGERRESMKIQFTPDDEQVIVSCGSLLVLDTRTWHRVKVLEVDARDFEIDPSNELLIVATFDGISVYDMNTWELIDTPQEATDIEDITLSSDGLFLAVLRDHGVTIWRTEIWEPIDGIDGDFKTIKFLRNTEMLGCLSHGNELSLWSLD